VKDHFYLTSAAAAERHDQDLLCRHATNHAGVSVKNRTEECGILGLMGPRSRKLLEGLTTQSLRNEDFPWLTAKLIDVAGVPVRALRVSYIGELGWELHTEMRHLRQLYQAIKTAGKDLGISAFGSYAMNAMRLEKGYRAWGLDLTTERTPIESGLSFLVKSDGRDFVGRHALLQRSKSPKAWRMDLLEIGSSGVDPFYSHTVLQDGRPVGIVTSAAHGHRTGKVLALAYFKPEADLSKENLQVRILGDKVDARVLPTAPFDPKNRRVMGID
jgi:dimethylglycine dehydrogenase